MSTFDDAPFLRSPRHVGDPSGAHAAAARRFQGIPSVAIAPGGRRWATWYAGPTPAEDQNNYVVAATSPGDGQSWTDVLAIDPDGPGPVRAFDPEAWVDPLGRLWLFWAQAVGHNGSIGGVWALRAAAPATCAPQWEPPRRLTDGVMMCKPIVLTTGEWLLPVSTWRETDHSARVVISTDEGETWWVRGACHVPVEDRDFDEHMVVERTDGSLWMLVRTRYGIGESVSQDRGRTWSDLRPTGIPNAVARFFITRLASGSLLLVKHGPLDRQIGRSYLTAFRSADEGRTWRGGLVLDEREGVSYPDGQQTPDGAIHVIYDFERSGERAILLARFTEDDIDRGDPRSATVSLREVVSRPG